jgi:glycosyltransferase involved in cell wall biosynthesis
MPFTIGIDARKAHDFGIGTYIRGLVRALAAVDQENRYLLFVGTAAATAFADLPANFSLVIERAPVYSLREQFALSWQLFRRRLDLYHATHYVLPALVPCPAVVTIHDIIHLLYPEFLPNRLAFLYAQRMIGSSLQRGRKIIAVSENTRADLASYFKMDGKKIQVIYNGVDTIFRQRLDPDARDRVLAELGIRPPYLLFLGNPKPHKNLDRVLAAYAQARRQQAIAEPLICVGDKGGAEGRIRQQAEALGIADHVQLVGHVPDAALPAIYQGATLFLYPTLYEGFGLPVVEAMASGTPVITANTSALREIAEGYAQLVNPLDVDQMAEAINRCLADAPFRANLAERGRMRESDFRWERTARKTLALYLSVIRTSKRLPAEPAATTTLGSGVRPRPSNVERPSGIIRMPPPTTGGGEPPA